MDRNVVYDAFTLNNNLEVVECKGIVAINNGYDRRDSGVKELQIITEPNCYLSKWFSLNREDVVKVQKENIKECNTHMTSIINEKLNELNLQLEEYKNNEYIKEYVNLNKIISKINIKIIKKRREKNDIKRSILQIPVAAPVKI